jgi:hypothetical protein
VLPALLKIAEGVALERDGALVGFALFRPFGRGHAIGPVVALETPEGAATRAKALIAYWLAKNSGSFTRIDTPDDAGLSSWLEEMGLPRVDTVVKMVRNGVLTTDPHTRESGIINQALG